MTGAGAQPRAALLIVDMQQGFAREDAALHGLADRIALYVDGTRERYALVAATQFRNEPGSSYDRLIGDEMRSDDDVALLAPIAERADAAFESHRYAKAGSELQALLTEREIEVLHVCGADTDQCVLATVLEAFDAGLTPVALADLCHSCAGDDPQEAGLIALRRAIGEPRVVSSDAAFDVPLGRV